MDRSMLRAVLVALLAGCSVRAGSGGSNPEPAAPAARPGSGSESAVVIDDFQDDGPDSGLPRGWSLWKFRRIARPTDYSLVTEGKNTFVRASSQAAAAALYRPVTADLARRPMLAWRWRVANVLEHEDPTRRSGDDFPARVLIGFATTRSAPTRADTPLGPGQMPDRMLQYVWSSKLPVGTMVPNPNAPSRVKQIVARSGLADPHQWYSERHNLADDYRRAFGAEPGRVVFIAIMSDTDNTGEAVQADYDDFRWARPAAPVKREVRAR